MRSQVQFVGLEQINVPYNALNLLLVFILSLELLLLWKVQSVSGLNFQRLFNLVRAPLGCITALDTGKDQCT